MTEVPHKDPVRKPRARKRSSSRRVFVPCAPLELESFARIDWALRTILKELKQNSGIYPHYDRAPNVREVLRRASLSERFLEFQNGNTYREAQKARFKRKIKRVLGLIGSERYHALHRLRPGSDRVRAKSESWLRLQEQLRSLKQRWVEAELEFIDAQNRLRDLEQLTKKLSEENKRLRALVPDSNIHNLHPTRD